MWLVILSYLERRQLQAERFIWIAHNKFTTAPIFSLLSFISAGNNKCEPFPYPSVNTKIRCSSASNGDEVCTVSCKYGYRFPTQLQNSSVMYKCGSSSDMRWERIDKQGTGIVNLPYCSGVSAASAERKIQYTVGSTLACDVENSNRIAITEKLQEVIAGKHNKHHTITQAITMGLSTYRLVAVRWKIPDLNSSLDSLVITIVCILSQVPVNAVISQRLHAGLMRYHWVVWQRRGDILVSCLWMSYTAYWWYNSPCPSLQLVRSIDYQINLLHSFMLWNNYLWILHVVMLLTQIGCSWFILELDIAFVMTIIWVALQLSSFCMIEISFCTTGNQYSFYKERCQSMKCGTRAVKKTMKNTVKWLKQQETNGDLLLRDNIHDYTPLQLTRTFKLGSVVYICPNGTVMSHDGNCGESVNL